MNALIPKLGGEATLSRRRFMAGSALVVSFAAFPSHGWAAASPPPDATPLGDLKTYP